MGKSAKSCDAYAAGGNCRAIDIPSLALPEHAFDTCELARWSAAAGAVDMAARITPDVLYKREGFFAECTTSLAAENARGAARHRALEALHTYFPRARH